MEERDERLVKVALNFLPGMTPEMLKAIHETGRDYRDIFNGHGESSGLYAIMHLGGAEVAKALERGRQELEFMDRHGIRMLFMLDDDYPSGLFEMTNPPISLFYLGEMKPECAHSLSVVGTRRCTRAGLEFCNKMVEEAAGMFTDLSIVSGLAYGIDAAAHVAALKNGVHTMAIVAHGLDMIYPAQHRNLAKEIINAGGVIVSEYPSGTRPYKGRFLERNRIVGCISRGVVVVESAIRGGAMSTANTAFSYSRDVFAVPGRPADEFSQGCNLLIMKNKAHLTTGIRDIVEELGWKPDKTQSGVTVQGLFPELDGDAQLIYNYLRDQRKACSTDSIHLATSLSISRILSALGELEFDGIVVRLPGNRYELA